MDTLPHRTNVNSFGYFLKTFEQNEPARPAAALTMRGHAAVAGDGGECVPGECNDRSTATTLLTADDLWRLPPDGRRRELVRGELRTMPPGGADHGDVTNNFAFLLTAHVKPRALGRVFAAETGFRLARNPDTVVGADVAFVPASRIPRTGLPKGFWEGAPDLAVETVSPGDTVEEVEEKVDGYLAAGARAVLVLNPRRKTVTSHRPGQNPLVQHRGDVLDLDDVVPGFSCEVVAIFS